MKRRYALLWLLFLVLVSCQSGSSGSAPDQPEEISVPNGTPAAGTPLPPVRTAGPATSQPTPPPGVVWTEIPPSELFDSPWQDNACFLAGLQPESQHWVEDLPYATRYRMELTIPQSMDRLTGKQEALYTNLEEEDLTEIVFRLFPNINGGRIEVSNLRLNGLPAAFTLENADSTMAVPLKEPLQPYQSLLIQMDFVLTMPLEMGGNYGLFGYIDEVLMLDTFSPMIPVYDDDGWYRAEPSHNGDLTYNDASFYLVRVIAPLDLVMAAAGVQVEEQIRANRREVVYALGPARDFTLAGSTGFVMDSRERDGITVHSYGMPGMEAGMELARETALDALGIFTDLIGRYDYTEFDVVATPMLAGGIEYPGMTWVNQQYFDLAGSYQGTTEEMILESVTAHETAHMWFYNAVGNDQSEMPWVDESLVQYVTGLYFGRQYGPDALETMRTGWESRWSGVDYTEIPIGMPTGAYSQGEYNAIVYGRGPLFFEALADEMGVQDFNAFLAGYYERFHWEEASTVDVLRTAEEYCHCDLDDLFEKWIYPADE